MRATLNDYRCADVRCPNRYNVALYLLMELAVLPKTFRVELRSRSKLLAVGTLVTRNDGKSRTTPHSLNKQLVRLHRVWKYAQLAPTMCGNPHTIGLT